MSEDVDIKMIPSIDVQTKSRSIQRKLRGQFYQKLRESLAEHKTFELVEIQKLDEGKFLRYHIEYPRYHQLIDAIRPFIQLEITESLLLEPPIIKSISSMHAEALQLSPELSQCPCATIEVTASEKFVSLLRRTAAYARDNKKKDDETDAPQLRLFCVNFRKIVSQMLIYLYVNSAFRANFSQIYPKKYCAAKCPLIYYYFQFCDILKIQ